MQMSMRIRISRRIEEWDDEEREPHWEPTDMNFGAKSGPSDQIGQPGHLSITCVNHNIGNELTVEVN